jgi:PhnB protein
MIDPLESLHRPSSPAQPRPDFAAELRRQVEAEFRRISMTDVPISLTPMLSVSDPEGAIQFYKEVFGATECYVTRLPGGAVLGQLAVGNATFDVSSESEEYGNLGPQALGGTSVRLSLIVPDPDAVAERAVAAGARIIFPIADQPYGYRQGRIEDPFGHQWLIGRPLEERSPGVER